MVKSRTSAATVARLVDAISNDIMYGAFATGHRLKLVEMQERYDASQFEVRKALAELATRRLVEHLPNAGFRVVGTDHRQRLDFDYVRILLERPASRLVAARATADQIAELRTFAERFDNAIMNNNRAAQSDANEAFHDCFYEISGNIVLKESIAALRNNYDITTSGRWNTVEGLKISAAQHWQMIEAIEERDIVALEQLIVDHVHGF